MDDVTPVNSRTVRLTSGREIVLPQGLLEFHAEGNHYTARFPAVRGKHKVVDSTSDPGTVLWTVTADRDVDLPLRDGATQLVLPHGSAQLERPVTHIVQAGDRFIVLLKQRHDKYTELISLDDSGREHWRLTGDFFTIEPGLDETTFISNRGQFKEYREAATGALLRDEPSW